MFVSLILAFVAVVLYHKTSEFRFIYHAILMIPFIHIGYWFKKKLFSNWIVIIISALLYLSGSILMFAYDKPMPIFEHYFGVDANSFIPFVLFAITGSIMVVGLSKILDCKLIQSIGKQSLVIYIFNTKILTVVFSLFPFIVSNYNNNPYISSFVFALLLVITIAISMMAAKILNTKYLKWLLGKLLI